MHSRLFIWNYFYLNIASKQENRREEMKREEEENKEN